MKLKHSTAILLVSVLFSFSCTPYKTVPYFQDLKKDSILREKITNYSPLIIQPGDLLALQVTSLNHDADAVFNYNLERPNGLNAVGRAEQTAVFGYLVDPSGNIHLPLAGNVKVSGLTSDAISALLETKLSDYLTGANIKVRIQNFKVSVMGDVKNPGVYNIPDERVTLPEALTMAGDLNTTGIRNNILLVREIEGKREYIRLDLGSKSIFNSPYFYLKNNDMIYVQPNRDKVAATDSAFQKVALLISALSLVAIFFTRVK